MMKKNQHAAQQAERLGIIGPHEVERFAKPTNKPRGVVRADVFVQCWSPQCLSVHTFEQIWFPGPALTCPYCGSPVELLTVNGTPVP